MISFNVSVRLWLDYHCNSVTQSYPHSVPAVCRWHDLNCEATNGNTNSSPFELQHVFESSGWVDRFLAAVKHEASNASPDRYVNPVQKSADDDSRVIIKLISPCNNQNIQAAAILLAPPRIQQSSTPELLCHLCRG
jgi:hypothetical protein